MVIAAMLFITVIGIVLGYILAVGAGIWVFYRIIRGCISLNDGRSMPG